MAIDNIVAAAAAATNSFSPLPTSMGFSELIGFLIGYAIKQTMKLLVAGARIIFAALVYLELQNIVNINWNIL